MSTGHPRPPSPSWESNSWFSSLKVPWEAWPITRGMGQCYREGDGVRPLTPLRKGQRTWAVWVTNAQGPLDPGPAAKGCPTEAGNAPGLLQSPDLIFRESFCAKSQTKISILRDLAEGPCFPEAGSGWWVLLYSVQAHLIPGDFWGKRGKTGKHYSKPMGTIYKWGWWSLPVAYPDS